MAFRNTGETLIVNNNIAYKLFVIVVDELFDLLVYERQSVTAFVSFGLSIFQYIHAITSLEALFFLHTSAGQKDIEDASRHFYNN